MKFTTAVVGIAALLTSAVSAAPAEVQARATSANVSNFAVSCNGSTCTYSANILLVPDNVAVSCTHSTTGATIPTASGFWTCSVTGVLLNFLKIPNTSYRIAVTDSRTSEGFAQFHYLSPLSNWPGNAAYTGPSSFTAS